MIVILRVSDSGACRGILNISPLECLDIIHRILMAEFPAQNIREDLKLAMLLLAYMKGRYSMCRESGIWCHAIFIDNSQGSKFLELGVKVVCEGEGVE
jgi:hypothetical protein